jgi:hypothetical protein
VKKIAPTKETITKDNLTKDNIANKKFIQPTLDDLIVYFSEIKGDSNVSPKGEASRFLANHESKGWLIGKSPMKDWKAACRTWKLNGEAFGRISKEPRFDGQTAGGFRL